MRKREGVNHEGIERECETSGFEERWRETERAYLSS